MEHGCRPPGVGRRQLASAHPSDRLAAATIVGLGGGTALDTAKYVAWKLGRPLVQVPTITSVDAGFTDAIGVGDQGRVRYIGTIVPEVVVLDLALVRSAPARLDRAGVGDILSCRTGLFDWRLATDHGCGHPWHPGLAALGVTLLDELEAAAEEIAAVSDDGVRFIADAYRRIGAACAWAGHSRFEEGSEHLGVRVRTRHWCAPGARGDHLVRGLRARSCAGQRLRACLRHRQADQGSRQPDRPRHRRGDVPLLPARAA